MPEGAALDLAPAPGAGDAAVARPVRSVMRSGVVLCDADASVEDVARAMRDRGVRSVLAVDISSELIGMIDERALVAGWQDPERQTAAAIMDADPLIIAPDLPVGEAARLMLEREATTALVAWPPPSEESGAWSEWKERGLPVGTLTVADILGRLDELAAQVRATPTQRSGPGRRVAPWMVLVSIIVVVAVVAGLIVAYALGTHSYTHRPGL